MATIISEHIVQSRIFENEDFQNILKKANERARQYLRNFLYSGQWTISLKWTRSIYFILDAEMKPMDQNYKEIAWPNGFYPFRDWQSVEPLAKVWGPIFAEFDLVPNVWGPQDEEKEKAP